MSDFNRWSSCGTRGALLNAVRPHLSDAEYEAFYNHLIYQLAFAKDERGMFAWAKIDRTEFPISMIRDHGGHYRVVGADFTTYSMDELVKFLKVEYVKWRISQ